MILKHKLKTYEMGHACSNTCYKPCLADLHKKLEAVGISKMKIEALMRKAKMDGEEKSDECKKGDDDKEDQDKEMPDMDDMKKVCM